MQVTASDGEQFAFSVKSALAVARGDMPNSNIPDAIWKKILLEWLMSKAGVGYEISKSK